LIDYEIRDTITLKGVDLMIKFKVKVMLAKREMTQKELAERTGIRPPTVSAICTGSVKHLPVEALNKICEVLECQPADLMEYVDDEVVQ
jgi:putative transcriptional regulator